MDEGGEAALGAGSPPHPRLMESIDPHCERLEPFFDQVAIDVVNVTAGDLPVLAIDTEGLIRSLRVFH